ncbi:hypothetical protein G9A89_010555 [Geosiphon pyriformis]|nr:hypothetical protein G9A89_010555 [Geosiphon pyriformis]
MSPRTDLCDMCQHFQNGLQYNARKEEEAKDLLKRYKEHLVKAKLERNYYNKNTKLAEQRRKLVDEHFRTRLLLLLITVTIGHKMFTDQQVSKIYYLSPRKVHLFGIQDEAVREKINYVLDEDEIIGKGPNVICGYYERIELNFMVPGHTKFKCDGSFGLIKKLYRKTTSSVARLNKARRYNNRASFQYFDIISGLEAYFKKLPGLQKFQHFLFTRANPGVVKVQEFANTSKSIEKIKALSFSVLVPPPMKYERQEYLYNYIRPFVKDAFKDQITQQKNRPIKIICDWDECILSYRATSIYKYLQESIGGYKFMPYDSDDENEKKAIEEFHRLKKERNKDPDKNNSKYLPTNVQDFAPFLSITEEISKSVKEDLITKGKGGEESFVVKSKRRRFSNAWANFPQTKLGIIFVERIGNENQPHQNISEKAMPDYKCSRHLQADNIYHITTSVNGLKDEDFVKAAEESKQKINLKDGKNNDKET